MRKQIRDKRSRLATILDRHEGFERRTLADIHNAGYKFQTITQARYHLSKVLAWEEAGRQIQEEESA